MLTTYFIRQEGLISIASPIGITTARGDVCYPCWVLRLRDKPRKRRRTKGVDKRAPAGRAQPTEDGNNMNRKPRRGGRMPSCLPSLRDLQIATCGATVGCARSYGNRLPTSFTFRACGTGQSEGMPTRLLRALAQPHCGASLTLPWLLNLPPLMENIAYCFYHFGSLMPFDAYLPFFGRFSPFSRGKIAVKAIRRLLGAMQPLLRIYTHGGKKALNSSHFLCIERMTFRPPSVLTVSILETVASLFSSPDM